MICFANSNEAELTPARKAHAYIQQNTYTAKTKTPYEDSHGVEVDRESVYISIPLLMHY